MERARRPCVRLRFAPAGRPLDHRAQVIRPQVEQRPGPIRAWTAPAGWSPASRAARSAGGTGPGTRCVASSLTWPSVSSSLNVRSAAMGVRSSCDTSARKSRLRSRSRRMNSIDVLDALGHAVEGRRQLAHLARAPDGWPTRVSRWPRTARAPRRSGAGPGRTAGRREDRGKNGDEQRDHPRRRPSRS